MAFRLSSGVTSFSTSSLRGCSLGRVGGALRSYGSLSSSPRFAPLSRQWFTATTRSGSQLLAPATRASVSAFSGASKRFYASDSGVYSKAIVSVCETELENLQLEDTETELNDFLSRHNYSIAKEGDKVILHKDLDNKKIRITVWRNDVEETPHNHTHPEGTEEAEYADDQQPSEEGEEEQQDQSEAVERSPDLFEVEIKRGNQSLTLHCAAGDNFYDILSITHHSGAEEEEGVSEDLPDGEEIETHFKGYLRDTLGIGDDFGQVVDTALGYYEDKHFADWLSRVSAFMKEESGSGGGSHHQEKKKSSRSRK
ncbi:hypothetical protein QOT17_010513 [Balamuthia mandrillaris]